MHCYGGLAKYKTNLLTVGCSGQMKNKWSNGKQATEIMQRNNDTFIWSVVDSNLFADVQEHSLVTVPPSKITGEYVLLIGGNVRFHDKTFSNFNGFSGAVYKFNGKWSFFGKLNGPRRHHNSIYWNGAVYVIGGDCIVNNSAWMQETKMEIWKIAESPNEFKTTENWPELRSWNYPHLFIVPDSLFPDY